MVIGTIKWFSAGKGFGFIISSSGQEHYFRAQSVNGRASPSKGDSVTFDPIQGDKGPRAVNVTVTKKAAPQHRGRVDDRVTCPGCGRKIVPRMITYRGEPEKSVCPYCATLIVQFSGCFIATAV